MNNLNQLFRLADNAKNLARYDVADAVFAHLLAAHRTNHQLKIQYEFAWYEGNPRIAPIQNVCTESIEYHQYNALVVVYTGDRTKPENYLCCPAPMLSTKALRYAFKAAKREGGFVERRAHGRIIREGGDTFPSLKQIIEDQKLKVPSWVFFNPINPSAPALRVALKRGRPQYRRLKQIQ